MAHISFITLEVADPMAAERFYTALGVGDRVRLRASETPTTGFRGFTLSITVPQPSVVDSLMAAAVGGGAHAIKPAEKSLWGYGGAVQAPDGTVCTVASSSKKNRGPATRESEDVVLQLGVANVPASKRFYIDRGVPVAKSFGRRYAELDTSPITLALLPRKALAKAVGLPADGSGSHRLAIASDIGPFTDPDGFGWEDPTS